MPPTTTSSTVQLTWQLADQMQQLQATVSALADDNATLKHKVAALEASVVQLQGDSGGAVPGRGKGPASGHGPGAGAAHLAVPVQSPTRGRSAPATPRGSSGSGGGAAKAANSAARPAHHAGVVAAPAPDVVVPARTQGAAVPPMPFAQALGFAHTLRLVDRAAWGLWCKNSNGHRPASLPTAPDRAYRHGGWQGWAHWLGIGNVGAKRFLPFKEAQALAQSLELASAKAWCTWSKSGTRPANVPSSPDQVYADAGCT